MARPDSPITLWRVSPWPDGEVWSTLDHGALRSIREGVAQRPQRAP